MTTKQKILIVDDDENIAELLSLYLTKECFDTQMVYDGEEALRAFDSYQPNLILLDLMLPGIDGYQVCREIRSRPNVPIIMLSAKGEVFDTVLGLELGADDYIVKPFSNTELLLRVRSLLRRAYDYSPAQGSSSSENKISYKDLVLDLDSQSVQKDGQTISLTWTEFQILELFISNRGRIYSLDHIYQSIWQEDAVGDGTIMVHIKNLRKKLGDNSRNPIYIKTAWGKGYYVD